MIVFFQWCIAKVTHPLHATFSTNQVFIKTVLTAEGAESVCNIVAGVASKAPFIMHTPYALTLYTSIKIVGLFSQYGAYAAFTGRHVK